MALLETTVAPPYAQSLPAHHRGLYRFAVGVVLAVLVLIKAGAMVTSTGSGLAFADWPLANGSLWPVGMKLPGLFEHGHRLMGALIGVLSIVLCVWIWVADARRWMHRLALTVVGLVVVQGLIGGLGIRERLPAITSVSHGVLAQLILCTLTFVAFALSPAWASRTAVDASRARTARRLATGAMALLLLQLVLGALLRHTNIPMFLWLHVSMAMVVMLGVMIATFYAVGRVGQVPGLQRLGSWIITVLLCQVCLGFVTLIVRQPKNPENIHYLGRAFVVTGHVVVGASLFLLVSLLAYRTWRNLVAADRA